MKLTRLSIKNFRSLEAVELTGLSQFNVLIGKNNAGKSAFFAAIRFLADVVHGRGTWAHGEKILSIFAPNSNLEITLEFAVSEKERAKIIPMHVLEGGTDDWINSAYMRHVQFTFRSYSKDGKDFFPAETKVRGKKEKWLVLQTGDRLDATKCSVLVKHATLLLGNEAGDVDIGERLREAEKNPTLWDIAWAKDIQLRRDNWAFFLLAQYLENAFFFDHVRRYNVEQSAGGDGKLQQDGSNLVQVLNYWSNNHRPRFDRIQDFVQRAFSGVGGLETPFTRPNQQSFHAAFRNEGSEDQIALQHMGGGVAQMLMAAIALETTSIDNPIFIEEPETNLHPGAQRFLAERLCAENRQIFITTHSPTFINLPYPKSVHKISMAFGKTVALSLKEDTLHAALSEIGARNSDVLMSDAVVFVEGESDVRVFHSWCKILGIEIAGTNTSILPTHSIARPEIGLRIRSETLKDIASNAQIPHLFILDGDELSDSTVERLKADIGEKLYIFERRELENYLLIPRALRLAIRERLEEEGKPLDGIDKTGEKEIQKIIQNAAARQKRRVLLKRIRAQFEPPHGGVFPRILFEKLERYADSEDLESRLAKSLDDRFSQHLSKLKIKKVVLTARAKLDKEWETSERRMEIAPGEELLEKLFLYFDLIFNKTTDGPRIAKHMTPNDLCDEVKALLEKVRGLTESKPRHP